MPAGTGGFVSVMPMPAGAFLPVILLPMFAGTGGFLPVILFHMPIRALVSVMFLRMPAGTGGFVSVMPVLASLHGACVFRMCMRMARVFFRTMVRKIFHSKPSLKYKINSNKYMNNCSYEYYNI
jgi:hypothetical protein